MPDKASAIGNRAQITMQCNSSICVLFNTHSREMNFLSLSHTCLLSHLVPYASHTRALSVVSACSVPLGTSGHIGPLGGPR